MVGWYGRKDEKILFAILSASEYLRGGGRSNSFLNNNLNLLL